MFLLRKIHGGLTLLTMMGALYAIFVIAPRELTMGIVQKIFYFHVSAAWIGFFGIYVVFFCSLLFLIKGGRQWDIRAASAAEVGVIFFTLNLVSGPIWAKPVWGIWWTWDARLTTSFILWLIYLGYLMIRRLVENSEQRARLSAVVSILGSIDAPIVYMANRWWRTQHPQPVVAGDSNSGLHPDMQLALLLTLMAFTMLFFYLWKTRINLEQARDDLDLLERTVHFHVKEAR